jgi:hypothetical protein
MSEEEVVDCVIEIDQMLSEIEDALACRDDNKALHKIREARDAIEDVREDDDSAVDRQDVEMDVMRTIK